ncbi:MAG: hypothetical protein QG622_2838 [Actinomycetota bacterium]|nr:hypothetical protein [Actinomycetota bacterium]
MGDITNDCGYDRGNDSGAGRRSPGQRASRRCLAGTVILLICGLQPAAASPGPVAASGPPVSPAAGSRTAGPDTGSLVTLPTGDTVRVTHRDGQAQVSLNDGRGKAKAAVVRRVGEKVYVFPVDAREALLKGTLDREAFEVTGKAAAAQAASPSAAKGDTLVVRTDGTAAATPGEQLYDVDVTVLDRKGRPAAVIWGISAFRAEVGASRSVLGPLTDAGVQRFRLSAGTWVFYGEIATENGDRRELVQVFRTGVRLPVSGTGPLPVVLDGRKAVPAALDVTGLGATKVVESSQGFSWSIDYGDGGTGGVSSGILGDAQSDVYLTPVPAVTEPGFQYHQVVYRRLPDAGLRLDTAAGPVTFDLDMMRPDDRVQGTRTLRLVPITPSQPADDALPGDTLALAEVSEKSGFKNGDTAIAAAVARKAAAVVLWSADHRYYSLKPQTDPPLPVLTPTADTVFSRALATGATTGTLTVDQWNHPTVALARHATGQIPAQLTATYPKERLARVRHVYRSQPDVTYGRHSLVSALGTAFSTVRFVRFGTDRIDYVTPDFPWTGQVNRSIGGWRRGAWYSTTSRTFAAGRETAQDWGGPVQRSSVMADEYNSWVVRVAGNRITGYVSSWTDGAGHPSSPGDQEKVRWRIASEGTQIASGTTDGFQGSTAIEGRHRYELAYDTARPTGTGADGTVSRTVWGFPMETNEDDGDIDDRRVGRVVPMLSVDPEVPVDARGTVPAGTRLTFDVDGNVVATPAARLETVKVWTWAQGAPRDARTEATSVERVDGDTFRVTIPSPKAPAGSAVGLRIVATGSGETSIDQTVEAAFTLR